MASWKAVDAKNAARSSRAVSMSVAEAPTGMEVFSSKIASPVVVSAPVRVSVLVSFVSLRTTPENTEVGLAAVRPRDMTSLVETLWLGPVYPTMLGDTELAT